VERQVASAIVNPVAVTGYGRTGCCFPLHTIEGGGQYHGKREVGIGVGTGDPISET